MTSYSVDTGENGSAVKRFVKRLEVQPPKTETYAIDQYTSPGTFYSVP